MIYIVLFFMTVLVDCLGSTIALTDQDKSITDRFSYDPWGYCIHSIGDSDTPFKYVGAFGIQTDPNGLVNMRARYYNPATKTFLTSDPSGFEGGLNWYLYANGNPYSYIDQNGEVPVLVVTALVGAGIGAAIEASAEIINQLNDKSRNGNSFSSFDFTKIALSATKGAIVGAVSAVITPVSGTIAMGIGFKASSTFARTISIGSSAGVSAITQVGYNFASNEYLGTQNNLTDGVLSNAIFGGLGQGVSSIIKTTGYSTISQATKFNAVPKTIPKYFTSSNGRALLSSFGTSSFIGAIPSFK